MKVWLKSSWARSECLGLLFFRCLSFIYPVPGTAQPTMALLPASAPQSLAPEKMRQHEVLWEGSNYMAQYLYPTPRKVNHFSSLWEERLPDKLGASLPINAHPMQASSGDPRKFSSTTASKGPQTDLVPALQLLRCPGTVLTPLHVLATIWFLCILYWCQQFYITYPFDNKN